MQNYNAIVGQSGGPTAAINATLAGVIGGVYSTDKIDKIYGMLNGIQGLLNEELCVLNDIVSETDLTSLANTPAAALGSCRMKLPDLCDDSATYEKLFDILAKYNIKYFFYIGGNDSMDTVNKMSSYAKLNDIDIKVIGVPKTIDNDLTGTDHSPGYGSAAKFIAAMTQEVIRDCAVYKQNAVTIIEIMGRDAGWLTAAAGLPKIISGTDNAPDFIYLCEKLFDEEKFLCDVQARFDEHPNIVIAVSEGLKDLSGGYLGAADHKGVDVFGHSNLSGTGKYLELLVKERLGCKVRSIELNILQRCAAHILSKTDIDESLLIGREAVNAAIVGTTGCMMSYKRISTAPYEISVEPVDIALTANQVRAVPNDFINAEANYVTDECLEYIAPLINGEVNVEYVGGLPKHFIIKK